MSSSTSSTRGYPLSLQKDDVSVFESLYKTYWYQLYCVARKHTHSSEDAEELVQTLFEKIWKNRANIQVKNWGPFLMISLKNLIVDFHRQQSARQRLIRNYQPSPDNAVTEEHLYQNQVQEIINTHLQELPQKTQEIFRLSRFEHKSVKEIAGTMRLSEKAVEYHITRSIKLLRHYLREHLSFFFQFL